MPRVRGVRTAVAVPDGHQVRVPSTPITAWFVSGALIAGEGQHLVSDVGSGTGSITWRDVALALVAVAMAGIGWGMRQQAQAQRDHNEDASKSMRDLRADIAEERAARVRERLEDIKNIHQIEIQQTKDMGEIAAAHRRLNELTSRGGSRV